MDLLILLCVCLAVLAGLRVGRAASRGPAAAAAIHGAPMGGAQFGTGAWGRATVSAPGDGGRMAGDGGARAAGLSVGSVAQNRARPAAAQGVPSARGGRPMARDRGQAGANAPAARAMGDRWWDYLPPPEVAPARPL